MDGGKDFFSSCALQVMPTLKSSSSGRTNTETKERLDFGKAFLHSIFFAVALAKPAVGKIAAPTMLNAPSACKGRGRWGEVWFARRVPCRKGRGWGLHSHTPQHHQCMNGSNCQRLDH